MDDHSIKGLSIQFHSPKDKQLDSPKGSSDGKPKEPAMPAPQTKLTPLEETLFKGWSMANGLEDHDAPDNHYDFRGMFKESNGQVHPPGTIESVATKYNQIMSSQPDPIRDLINLGKPK